ncbi:MAG: hypothetical protein ACW986_13045 [Promethearchaeota archaeon]
MVLFIFSVILISAIFLSVQPKKTSFENSGSPKDLQTSGVTLFSEHWLENSNFSTQQSWNSVIIGDESDVDAVISQEQANILINGDSGQISIDEQLNDTDWVAVNNPEFPILPDSYGINSSGAFITHTWHESVDQTRNTPSIHWKRNITVPVNMSDYIITTASLTAVFNASVQALDHDGGGIEAPGDYTEGQNPPTDTQFGIGDSVNFYVLVSDIDNTNSFLVASNKTVNLGQDSPVINTHPDTLMNNIPEEVLKSYLMAVLEADNYNFTITLGIDVYCEDNEYNVDIDRWRALIIKSFNLTFTYKKKIDQFTTVTWEQTGNQLTGSNIQVKNAILGFEYKINTSWPGSLSPNSEIKAFINNKQYNETIKLTRATTIFQEAFDGVIDVTSMVLKDINISVSIQVFLADEFGLEEELMISIDNVILEIDYVEITTDIFTEPEIFRILLVVAIIIGVALGGYLIAYQRVLKYPKPVRKVRKYKRTLRRKNAPSAKVTNREKAIKKLYLAETSTIGKSLSGKPTTQKLPPPMPIKEKSIEN